MTQHVCPRCGHEDECQFGNWSDRHPVMAVIASLFTLVFMSMMFSVYPVAASAITALVACAVGLRAYVRERTRHRALAARADWEHRELLARAVQYPPPTPGQPPRVAHIERPHHPLPPSVRPRNPAPWHLVTQLPTTRFRRYP